MPRIGRRNFEDLLLSLDDIKPDNVAEHLPLIRDGIRDLGRRLIVLEIMGGANHPLRKTTKEQKS
jgi:hypothetical protein